MQVALFQKCKILQNEVTLFCEPNNLIMKDFTVAIYCLIDDLLQKNNNCRLDSRRKLTDSQVVTTVVLSCKYFYGNQASACK